MVLNIFLVHNIICAEDRIMSDYGSGRKTALIVVLALFVIECAAFALLSWSGQTAGKSVAIAVSGLFLAALFFFIHKFLVKNEKYVKATGLIIAVGLSDFVLAVYILISRLA